MSLSNFIDIPILAVNNYVWDQFKYMAPDLTSRYEFMPFAPLGADAQTFWAVVKQEDGSLGYNTTTEILYDRIFRYRPQPFYQIKKEQFSYKINATEDEYLEWGSALQLLLDREDDSAKDINTWNIIQQNAGGTKYPVYFHSMRVFAPAYAEFQQVSANDSTWVGQFIVDVQYHFTDTEDGRRPYDGQWIAGPTPPSHSDTDGTWYPDPSAPPFPEDS